MAVGGVWRMRAAESSLQLTYTPTGECGFSVMWRALRGGTSVPTLCLLLHKVDLTSCLVDVSRQVRLGNVRHRRALRSPSVPYVSAIQRTAHDFREST